MIDKQKTLEEVVSTLKDGMTIGIGGWGSRRKPMAFVRAIVRSGVKDLTVVSYGGPEVGILYRTGQLKKAIYGFVSLDSIPLEPHFRMARQKKEIEFLELDEGMFQLGLRAAAWNLPFLPTRAGLGSAVLEHQPEIKTVRSPYQDGEELVAMPALRLDAAFVHVNRADKAGNGQVLGPDPYFDDLFCMAADRAFVSAEEIVPTEDLLKDAPLQSILIDRMMVEAVVEAKGGAHFTECPPNYGRDEAFQKQYAATAKDPAAWDAFRARYLDVSEEEYQKAVSRND
ncbi:MAG: acyl CoA--acetate/3-ketoacid CoA transferase subunit alpha [Sandaracinaceae bacterium]|nr:acyl CoA--acetate/3-ketoacid CoA transferase subunit alpha [Sandaracinaceae bacterium]